MRYYLNGNNGAGVVVTDGRVYKNKKGSLARPRGMLSVAAAAAVVVVTAAAAAESAAAAAKQDDDQDQDPKTVVVAVVAEHAFPFLRVRICPSAHPADRMAAISRVKGRTCACSCHLMIRFPPGLQSADKEFHYGR